MSVDANALERETLERKDREELAKIVAALGGKATSRTRKADLIDQILELTGVTPADSAEAPQAPKPADAPTAESSTPSEAAKDAPSGTSERASKAAPTSAQSSSGESSSSGSVSARRQAARGGASGSGEAKGGDKPTDGPKNDGARNSGSRNDGPKNDGPKNDGTKNDGTKGGSASGNGSAQATSDNDDNDGDDGEDGGGKRRRRRGRNRDGNNQAEEYTGEPIPVAGILDLRDDGYGFLRVDGLLPSKDDCYVSVKQVRQFGLRKGDLIAGGARPAFRNEKNPAILRIDQVNGVELEPGAERVRFEELGASFATEQLVLSQADDPAELATRAVDLLAPVGLGSRVLVLSPPRAGKTTMLQSFARSIEANDPEVTLLVVLLDERPEEITEMRMVVETGTVYGSAFDAPADDHVAIVELALARAQRMAEGGGDVVVLLDGLTRLARAAHAGSQGVGRTLGGLDVAAIQTAKRAFGSGRNLVGAGSVTIVATATAGTGASADDAVVDSLVGAATTQIRLDGFAAARGLHPAIDVDGTGTRRQELLVGDDAAEQRDGLRRHLTELPTDGDADQADPLDGLLRRLRETGSNEELLASVAENGNGKR